MGRVQGVGKRYRWWGEWMNQNICESIVNEYSKKPKIFQGIENIPCYYMGEYAGKKEKIPFLRVFFKIKQTNFSDFVNQPLKEVQAF
jgi:hypothetical protein